MKPIARGGWTVILCLAVLALSVLSIPGPTPSNSPWVGRLSTDFVAITRAANLYDLSRTSTAIHEWKSDRQKLRLFRHGYGATVRPAASEIGEKQAAFENRILPASAALRQFQAFDAQAPPSAC
jgi:hypothetical protein